MNRRNMSGKLKKVVMFIRLSISKGLVIQKQVKNNAGKNERRLGVILTTFSSSKRLLINWKKKRLAND